MKQGRAPTQRKERGLCSHRWPLAAHEDEDAPPPPSFSLRTRVHACSAVYLSECAWRSVMMSVSSAALLSPLHPSAVNPEGFIVKMWPKSSPITGIATETASYIRG